MDDWISVKDRLPNYLEDVLTYGEDGIKIAHLSKNVDGYYFTDGLDFLKVRFWMPLIESPVEK